MKKIVIGILAHVDAGKTTLSESVLYLSGTIEKLGRVDKKDAYLDTHDLERERGITIFSKQAVFNFEDTEITLLDTPGHVDFSAEMERTLQVLDYAILVISGADGVQAHTKTLWRLLELYNIPVFIFINKMDQPGTEQDILLSELKKELHDGCINFICQDQDFYEELALCSEDLMEVYLNTGSISESKIKKAVGRRKVFPCFFGSALQLTGVKEFLAGIARYTTAPTYPEEFGAQIFKISRDGQGNRLTHLKLLGGSLKVRDALQGPDWEEKVNQIRIYSGEKFGTVSVAKAGTICAVTGLTQTKPGEGLGIASSSRTPVLEPVLSYQIILPDNWDPQEILPKLSEIEEEEPELRIFWDEQLQEIQARLMGEIQIEILQSLIENRFGVRVEFGPGKILYRETIANTVEGVGHFEPLRHYAEVHLLLEPGEQGSGLQFATACSEDGLSQNLQRLILTHLQEKTHLGVLTGSPITDLKITLVAGRSHNQHTQGGDFREATYRAVRQGLKEAQSILLEPFYSFQLEIPEQVIGRALTDLDRMHADSKIVQTDGKSALLVGSAPVYTMRNYHQEVAAYTRGLGRLFCSLDGYKPCHNSEQIIAEVGYDSEEDLENPTGSIFCKGGAGFYVSWDQVKEHMHLPRVLQAKPLSNISVNPHKRYRTSSELQEIDYELLERTVSANRGKKRRWKKKKTKDFPWEENLEKRKKGRPREEYLLVDGYNIIHAWPHLKKFTEENMDVARERLLNILANYKGIRRGKIMVVFDAYRVKGEQERVFDYHNLQVVFTKEAQTADAYIEKFAYDNQTKYKIKVATSDYLQQVIIRGAGCSLLSAAELWDEIVSAAQVTIKDHGQKGKSGSSSLQEVLSSDVLQEMIKLKENDQ